MELSDRKRKILKLVVDDYIETATPVSSRSITEKYLTTISSATVRSELSSLEELGYLYQPHTSGGRIPSKEAYKLYVSELMETDNLTTEQLDYIEKLFLEKTNDIETVVKNTAKVISELTEYTSLCLTAHDLNEVIRNIKLFRFKPDAALLVIVTDNKLLKDSVIDIPSDLPDDSLENANDLLGQFFVGKTFGEVCDSKLVIDDAFKGYKAVFLAVIDALKNYVSKSEEVVIDGEDKILDHPEYADVGKIRQFMSVVTKKDKVFNLLSGNKGLKVNVKIGADGYEEIPDDCSLVTATYSANGKEIATYGVIGPTRMDYKKVVSVLENVGRFVETILTKGDNNGTRKK